MQTIFRPKGQRSDPMVKYIEHGEDDVEVVYKGKHTRGTFMEVLPVCIAIASKVGEPLFPHAAVAKWQTH